MAQPPPLAPGSVFQGGYEIAAPLGAGSSGIVYRARQLSTGQDVAIKVVQPPIGRDASDASTIERFRREMRLGSELRHPNIVPLIDSGESPEGLLYAVFQYVPGATLRDVLTAEGKLSLAETIHLMIQVLDALSCAHTRGIVHRDLKPENVMVSQTGARRNALVLDFGLGGFAQDGRTATAMRITATQEMMGTPCYAAPEQLRGERPSTRSDLYSWGLILLECLTGELAVAGGSAQDVVMKQLGPEPVPIPSWLADRRLRRVLETVTAKQVEKRDVTIEGLIQALGAAVAPAPEPPSLQLDGERRQITVVSCGLTVQASPDHEPGNLERLDEVLHAQHAAIRELVAAHGGCIGGVLADRVLLAFGYPQAQEDDARRAARVALQIAAELAQRAERLEREQGILVEARVGVHTGVVIARELRPVAPQGLGDLVGITPQIATRVEMLAAPGEVLVSAETHRLLRTGFVVAAAGEHPIAGLAGTVQLFRLLEERRATADGDALAYAQPTPVVGRSEQLAQLTARWQQTLAGRPAAVLIRGEPGIGKSRLARELRRTVAPDAWLEARCVAEISDAPLRALVDVVVAMDESVESLLTRYGFDLPRTMPLFIALCGLPPDERFAPLPISPDRQKELMLETLVALFTRVATERPTVLVIEDLHWADPTTLELTTQLIQELRSAAVVGDDHAARLLLVLTARPEFASPWPAEDVPVLPLPRLAPSEVEEMVRAGLARSDAITAALIEQIVQRADGIPLFVEEVTRVLSEASQQRGGDGARDPGAVEIPSSLRDLLMARLDALSFGARETAQIAAALGREFRYEVLAAVARKHEQVLRDELRELTDTGLVYHRRSARAEAYVFKHALVRDVAYETMVRAARQMLHNRVANTLRQRFPGVEQQQPELIALHYESGDAPELAIEYWKRAGDRTMARGAYVESMRHFERGLALVRGMPESVERTRQELSLLESLGTALLATRGYTAPEVEEVFGHAAALCDQLGGDVPIRVLHGIWGVRIMRSDRDGTRRMIPILERITRESTDPVSLIAAHGAIGARAFFAGEFTLAAEASERATSWYRTKTYERFLQEYGYDGGIYVFGYLMWSALILGQVERAISVRDEMMAIAEQNQNPYGLAIAMQFSMNLARELGDAAAVLALGERALPMLTEQKIYVWLGTATTTCGWATAVRGDAEAGIAQMQTGLQLLDMIGIRTSYTYYLSGLAEAHLARGAAAEGLAAVEQGLAMGQELLDCFYMAELHRLRGALRLLQGQPTMAEACFRTALGLAEEQQAKWFALRAAMSLAALLAERRDRSGARAVLSEPCAWFRDSPPTPRILQARALFAELV